ncbi:MAG: hypothetical protein QGD94_06935 [Planctomycetia bacterium]|nr:hypothetical protein [Planctomycetia bacterium]
MIDFLVFVGFLLACAVAQYTLSWRDSLRGLLVLWTLEVGFAVLALFIIEVTPG